MLQGKLLLFDHIEFLKMKNIPLIPSLILLLFLHSCAFKIKVKERYYSSEELLEYTKAKKYPFDYILRFKNANYFNDRIQQSINNINFMNIYSKDNFLLKSSDGENCEFKIANFIKDSLDVLVPQKRDTISLKTLVVKSDVIEVVPSKDLFSNDNYKILIGWSVSLNNFGMIKKRLEKLFEQINSKDNRFIIIGMNLDPVRS